MTWANILNESDWVGGWLITLAPFLAPTAPGREEDARRYSLASSAAWCGRQGATWRASQCSDDHHGGAGLGTGDSRALPSTGPRECIATITPTGLSTPESYDVGGAGCEGSRSGDGREVAVANAFPSRRSPGGALRVKKRCSPHVRLLINFPYRSTDSLFELLKAVLDGPELSEERMFVD